MIHLQSGQPSTQQQQERKLKRPRKDTKQPQHAVANREEEVDEGVLRPQLQQVQLGQATQGSDKVPSDILHQLESALHQYVSLQALTARETAEQQETDKEQINTLQQELHTRNEQLRASQHQATSIQTTLTEQQDSHHTELTTLKQKLARRDTQLATLKHESQATIAQLSYREAHDQQAQIKALLDISSARDVQLATTQGLTETMDKQLAALQQLVQKLSKRSGAEEGHTQTQGATAEQQTHREAHPMADWDSTNVTQLQEQLYCMDGCVSRLRDKLKHMDGIANAAADAAISRYTSQDTTRTTALEQATDVMQQELTDVRTQLSHRKDELQQALGSLTAQQEAHNTVTIENSRLKAVAADVGRRNTAATIAILKKHAAATETHTALLKTLQADLLTELGAYQQLAELAVTTLQNALSFPAFAEEFVKGLPDRLAPKVLKDGLNSTGTGDISNELQFELKGKMAALERITPEAMLQQGLESAACWLIKHVLKFSKAIDRDVIRVLV